MEGLLFLLFIVAFQVIGSLLEARKKRAEYAEKMRRVAEAGQDHSPMQEYPLEIEEDFEEDIPPFQPAAHPDPSPIPQGLSELQELFRRFADHLDDDPYVEPLHEAPAPVQQAKPPAYPAAPTPQKTASQPVLDREHLRSAIIFSEILGKPKALRRSSHRFLDTF